MTSRVAPEPSVWRQRELGFLASPGCLQGQAHHFHGAPRSWVRSTHLPHSHARAGRAAPRAEAKAQPHCLRQQRDVRGVSGVWLPPAIWLCPAAGTIRRLQLASSKEEVARCAAPVTPRPFWARRGQEHCRAVEVSKDKAGSSYTELWVGSRSRQRPGGGRDGVGPDRLVQDLVPGDSEHRGFCSGGIGLRVAGRQRAVARGRQRYGKRWSR